MDDLAAELGMSKKTLYQHFPSKRALLQAVIMDKFRDVETSLAEATTSGSPTFEQTLERMLSCMHKNLSEIQRPFVRDMRREEPEMFQLVKDFRSGLIEKHFGRLFEKGRKEGMIRKDIPVDLMIEILLSAVQTILNPGKIEDYNLSPHQAYEAILSVILEGVLTAKGKDKK